MFKNLTTGQWAVFILLSCMTVFGGFLYLAAEAYFNRRDRAFATTPAGPAFREREATDLAAHNEARQVGPTVEEKASFWNSEVPAPRAALILAGVALGGILLLSARQPADHAPQVGEPAMAQVPALEERERCRPKSAEERWAYLELKKRLLDGTLTTSERLAAKIATGNFEIDLIGC
jgi:hypothetical protein